MSRFEQEVLQFIEDRQLIAKDKTVVIGLSGGPDSLALTHFLHKWQTKWNLRVTTVIVNHQLRGEEAERDVEFAQTICRKWNIPLAVKTIDVNEYKKTYRLSTQVAARELRYKAFAEAMDEFQADYLALGHHGDDQIETMTMQMIRSAHLQGILGIPYRRNFHTGTLIRPFLSVTKDAIETYCTDHKLTPQIDKSNEDDTYTRNFIRQTVVPHFKRMNQNVHVTMQQLAEHLREDETYLSSEAEKLFHTVVERQQEPREAKLKVSELTNYPASLQRRVFRLTLDYLYNEKLPLLHYNHEEILLSLLKDEVPNKQLHFPEHLFVEKQYDRLKFYFHQKKQHSFLTYVHTLPATIPLPNKGKLQVSLQHEWIEVKDPFSFICARSQIELPIVVRTRKPGDRMRYKGLRGSKKLKDIFIDDKIPRDKRDEMLVIADHKEEILWVIGLRKAILKRPTDEGPYVLFRYQNNSEEDRNA